MSDYDELVNLSDDQMREARRTVASADATALIYAIDSLRLAIVAFVVKVRGET